MKNIEKLLGRVINSNQIANVIEEVQILADGESKYKRNFTLKNGSKLSNVFDRLPFGIIDKRVTGIGGTTLELLSKRNSIIVEPLRSIAASKASEDKDNLIYIGSAFGPYKDRISQSKILQYLKSNKPAYKKFLVVADSLPALIITLQQEYGDDLYNKFFLLIDEIDSFQLDSTFRGSLEHCMDIYKKFNRYNRAVISATLLNFSDPDLINESITTFEYETPTRRKINLVSTDTMTLLAADKINDLIKKNPRDKILIACNSIRIARSIITDLTLNLNVETKKFGILCSNSNSDDAGEYFNELLDSVLPCQVNFMTSAYFTGVDINENYHAIAISSYKYSHTLLSDMRLKQIAGRCRKELLSETVIYECADNVVPFTELSVQELIGIGEIKLNSINCFYEHHLNSQYNFSVMEGFQKHLISLSDYFGYKLIRKTISDTYALSWFNIDAFIQSQQIKHTLYSNSAQLLNRLGESNEVTYHEFDSKREKRLIDKSGNDEYQKALMLETLESLKGVEDAETIYSMKSEMKNAAVREKVIDIYSSLLKFLNHTDSWNLTKEYYLKRDNRPIKFLLQSIQFEAMDSKEFFKILIYESFPLGNIFSDGEIQGALRKIYSQFHLPLEPLNSTINAKKHLNTYLKTSPSRKDGTQIGLKITGRNPKSVKIKPRAVTTINGKTYINFDLVD